uniref:T-complex protein 11-like protein 1 n=1 Tax=Glossina palpalis gambiensis TaxID=67801 RepID=A0A1B0BLH9_9MUSC
MYFLNFRMDTNGTEGCHSETNGTKTGGTDALLGTSPQTSNLRCRTDSESSDKMTRFVLPSMDGSPPKVLTLNELANVFKNIQNMELAHEIALNPEFKLQPYEPPENSLERRIKDILHKAFWDCLREELNQTPPCYDHAIQLLGDIKECFPQILSPTNKRTLEHINEVLDETVIRQQVEKGVLDFRSYADFVIQIMAKSCAPARDEIIQNLTKIKNVVDTFKGILETMTLMKLDMANFLLDFSRNDIMANSVEYEKQKFNEYLEYYKFGFPATENWLNRNRTRDANNVASTADQTISNAYMELMDWPDNVEFPEILSIDKERILKLGLRAKRLCICASLISISSAVPIISQRPYNRIELSKQFEILLQNMNDEKDVTIVMENIWEQIKININQYLQKEEQAVMDEASENMLKAQIMQIANKDAPVRQLMWKRLQTYFRLMLRLKTGSPPPPPGFADFKEELESYAKALRRVIAYNHSVFGDYFLQILNKHQVENSEINGQNETEIAMNGENKHNLLVTETTEAHHQ